MVFTIDVFAFLLEVTGLLINAFQNIILETARIKE